MSYAQLIDRIRSLAMVGKTGSDNRERLFCLFELRLDQIDLAEPVIGVNRQITFRIFIDKFVYPTNGLIVFFSDYESGPGSARRPFVLPHRAGGIPWPPGPGLRQQSHHLRWLREPAVMRTFSERSRIR